jgi:hypothetical protein
MEKMAMTSGKEFRQEKGRWNEKRKYRRKILKAQNKFEAKFGKRNTHPH